MVICRRTIFVGAVALIRNLAKQRRFSHQSSFEGMQLFEKRISLLSHPEKLRLPGFTHGIDH
jgi:hypothetical protein